MTDNTYNRDDWKVGDVAMVTATNRTTPYRAHYTGVTWREHGTDTFSLNEPTSIRPLVVLDPENPDQMGELVKAAMSVDLWGAVPASAGWSGVEHRASQVADALRELVTPRLPEPGPWGVVEASCAHSNDVRKWVHRDPDGYWVRVGIDSTHNHGDRWEHLVNPTLVRDGVTA